MCSKNNMNISKSEKSDLPSAVMINRYFHEPANAQHALWIYALLATTLHHGCRMHLYNPFIHNAALYGG